MKFLTLVMMLSAPGAAMACQHNPAQFICPGDPVVDSSGNSGTVTAINPFQKTAAYNVPGLGTFNTTIPALALGLGCLEAVCVGDQVVDTSGNTGTAIAVNPYSSQVAYRVPGLGTFLSQLRAMKVSYGCALGYCVGDGVVDSSGNSGVLLALSPYDDTAAYRVPGLGTFETRIETLGNTKYCDQYGDDHPARQAQHYPSMPSSRYSAPNFHYYPTRR